MLLQLVSIHKLYFIKKKIFIADQTFFLYILKIKRIFSYVRYSYIRKILKERYCYGYGATLTRVSKLEIPLPVASDGSPDWYMMEVYIKDQMVRIKQQERKN